MPRAHRTVLPAALIRPRPRSGPAHGSRGAVGAARHLGWDKSECPPLPPTGADGTPAQLARAHRTVLPAALIRPRPHSAPAHGSRGAVGAARHLGWDKTECPPLPPGPTGADGTPAQLARAHRTVPPEAADCHAAVSVKPLEYPPPAAGPRRRPGSTGRCRHRAHGTSAADCRRRFAHRSSQSGSTAADVLLRVVPAPVTTQYHCRSS